jgi:hypothetical protein
MGSGVAGGEIKHHDSPVSGTCLDNEVQLMVGVGLASTSRAISMIRLWVDLHNRRGLSSHVPTRFSHQSAMRIDDPYPGTVSSRPAYCPRGQGHPSHLAGPCLTYIQTRYTLYPKYTKHTNYTGMIKYTYRGRCWRTLQRFQGRRGLLAWGGSRPKLPRWSGEATVSSCLACCSRVVP